MNTQNGDVGLNEACRESGLSRHKVDHLEAKGFLGVVRRDGSPGQLNGGRNRRFTLEQRQVLVRYRQLRESGLSVEIAGAIAAEGMPGIDPISTDRLYLMARRNADELWPRLQAASIIEELLLGRLGKQSGGGPPAPATRGPAGSAVGP